MIGSAFTCGEGRDHSETSSFYILDLSVNRKKRIVTESIDSQIIHLITIGCAEVFFRYFANITANKVRVTHKKLDNFFTDFDSKRPTHFKPNYDLTN